MRLGQFRDGWVELIQQLKQIVPPAACPLPQLEGFQLLPATLSP